jgi:hypothetical protein
MQPQWPSTQKYIESRNKARLLNEAEFSNTHPEVAPLVAMGNEYVAGLIMSLSGRDLSMFKHNGYICDLVVSFARTHFIAQDLIGYGELIEAGVLIRKQIELLARLHELVKADNLEHLICKTPNVKALGPQIRRLYSTYSEVAHSSNPIHLQQLGSIEVNGDEYTAVYPKYDYNAMVTFQHQVLTVIELHNWTQPYLSNTIGDFDSNAADELIGDMVSNYVRAFPLR